MFTFSTLIITQKLRKFSNRALNKVYDLCSIICLWCLEGLLCKPRSYSTTLPVDQRKKNIIKSIRILCYAQNIKK